MKDTITLAELRKTELYRKEQKRPLREFLMENIDVLKLADEVEMWGEDLLALNMRGGIPVVQGAKMLRQQQNEIEDLINAHRFVQNFAEEQHKRAVALESELDRAVELYTDKAIKVEQLEKELTEAGGMIGVLREYISDLENGLDSSIKLNKAQALKKAQEK